PHTPRATLFPYTTLFRSWREKSLYGRSFMGIVRTTFVIDGTGVVRAVFPKVRVDGHVNEALAVVRDLSRDLSKGGAPAAGKSKRSEEHTSELQSRENLVC